MIFYVLTGFFLVCAGIILLANLKISVSRFEFSGDRQLKILQLSDLHKKKFGKGYCRLLKKIPQESFDAVLFTGDLISRSETDFCRKTALMKELLNLGPVYYIGGNHEADVPETFERLCSELEKTGVTVLKNSTEILTKNGKSTMISGLLPESRFYKNENGSYKNLPELTCDYLKGSLGEKSQEFTILLAHSPFAFEAYEKWGADYVLCGHVHGGVVRLPLVKGVLSPERKFFPEYSAGVFTKNKTTMVVSRGLGKFRLFNPSEIVIIDFKEQTK